MASLNDLCAVWLADPPAAILPLSGRQDLQGTPAIGGLSGSPVYRVEPADAAEPLVLKGFHPACPPAHAAWVHRLVRHLVENGISELPDPLPVRGGRGTTLHEDDRGMLWEMLPFKRGAPLSRPTAGQAGQTLALLARLHAAAARLPKHPPQLAVSPGHLRRLEQARRLLDRPWAVRVDEAKAAASAASDARLSASVVEQLIRAADRFARSGGAEAVAAIVRVNATPLPLQAVVRDLRSEHVLFDPAADAERPAGLIDLHAAGIDSVVTDIARLLGTWWPPTGRVRDLWAEAICEYERERPLSDRERGLIPYYQSSGTILSLDTWFRWILDEGRTFPDPLAVGQRVEELLESFETACQTLRDAVADPRLGC